MKKKKVIIIGAGIIGLHCGYYLHAAGHEVEFVEALPEDNVTGCSYRNSGLIVPSHFIPLASPAMLKSGLKMIFNKKSPVYLPVAKNLSRISWFLNFVLASNHKQVNKVIPALYQMHEESKKLYREIGKQFNKDPYIEEKGLLMIATTPKGFHEEIEISKIAGRLGLNTKILEPEALKNLEPDINFTIEGAVLYESDAQIQPAIHMQLIRNFLQKQGVQFHYDTSLSGFKVSDNKIKEAKSFKNSFKADEFVLAAGVFSRELAKTANLSLPVIAGKGYSIDFPRPNLHLKIPVILSEAKIALTPFNNFIRLGSGMEFNDHSSKVNPVRIQAMIERTRSAFPDFPEVNGNPDIWTGIRPVVPDGIPLIGRTRKVKNLLVATGHAMMGVSLAPVTGTIIRDIVEGKPGMFQDIINPGRYP